MDPITSRDTSRTVAHMFDLMDAWRHLPGFRLEGRLAPFFELFLLDVLDEHLGRDIELHPIVIPEFPLRIGTLYSKQELVEKRPKDDRTPHENQSYNVDYVAFSRDCKTAFLVELKTDMTSVDDKQKTYLSDARNLGLGPLVDGIVRICGTKGIRKRSKYVHLIDLLAKLELVTIPERESLYQMTFPQPRSGWTKAFDGVKPAVDGKLENTRVIYIQPRIPIPESAKDKLGQDFEYIYFRDVAEIVRWLGDLGSVFAHYLRKWAEDPGRRYPRTVADRS